MTVTLVAGVAFTRGGRTCGSKPKAFVNRTDVDRFVRRWLHDALDPELPLEPDLRLAIEAQRRGSVFVPHSFAPPRDKRAPLALLGERVLDGIAGYAYELDIPEQLRKYSIVMALEDNRICQVGINMLPDMSALPLEVRELKVWNIGLSLTTKLVWFGFLPAYGLSRTMHFHIDRKRWANLSGSERAATIDRAGKLTRDYRVITFARRNPVTFAINAHFLDAFGQIVPGHFGQNVHSGLA